MGYVLVGERQREDKIQFPNSVITVKHLHTQDNAMWEERTKKRTCFDYLLNYGVGEISKSFFYIYIYIYINYVKKTFQRNSSYVHCKVLIQVLYY